MKIIPTAKGLTSKSAKFKTTTLLNLKLLPCCLEVIRSTNTALSHPGERTQNTQTYIRIQTDRLIDYYNPWRRGEPLVNKGLLASHLAASIPGRLKGLRVICACTSRTPRNWGTPLLFFYLMVKQVSLASLAS